MGRHVSYDECIEEFFAGLDAAHKSTLSQGHDGAHEEEHLSLLHAGMRSGGESRWQDERGTDLL